MIIGRGDIAKAIKDREGFILYCNGVSNRLPLDEVAENKEISEVYNLRGNKTKEMFVYISTLSIYYSDSEYTKHKLRMEAKVKKWFRNYCILRIGNITWGDNPNTLLNHLKRDSSRVDDTFRYLIKEGELNHWVSMIPKTGKHEMNVPGTMFKIKDIIKYIDH